MACVALSSQVPEGRPALEGDKITRRQSSSKTKLKTLIVFLLNFPKMKLAEFLASEAREEQAGMAAGKSEEKAQLKNLRPRSADPYSVVETHVLIGAGLAKVGDGVFC